MSRAIRPLAVAVQAYEPVIGWGGPGIGKTRMTEMLAKHLGMHLETWIASQHDPVDIAGQPYVDSQDTLRKSTPDWAQALIDAGGGMLFMDEYTGATPAVQNATLTVILDKKVGRVSLPAKTAMVLMANPADIAAGGNELSAPTANRLCHLDFAFDHSAWIDGLVQGFPLPSIPIVPDGWQDGIPSQRILVAGFNKGKSTAAYMLPNNEVDRGKAWPSPRSWDMAARLRAAALAANAGKEVEIALTIGCIGQGMGAEFIAWIDAADLPNPEDLLRDPKGFKVPERGDRTFTILASVAAAFTSNMTRDRYLATWQIFNAATKSGHKDVAASSVVAVVKASWNKPFLADKDVREIMRENVKPFISILKQAGIAPESK